MKNPGWIRRVIPDDSQSWRRAVQGLFLTLNLWIGLEFALFVLGHEGRWVPWLPQRPAGVEGWLPIAGLLNTKYFLLTGEMPAVHPAAMVLIVTFLLLSFLLRKAFCGWLCPIGVISERLWKLGRETFRRSFFPQRWIDIPLRGLKYLLLSFFLYAVVVMGASEIGQFMMSPYGLVADIKMFNFFRFLTPLAAGVTGVLFLLSFFVPNAWCRYLCPYGALMGLVSMASPARIRREPAACIDCAKCAKACPSALPVDRLVQIRSAECLGCMECVAACPAEGALAMQLGPGGRKVAPRTIAVAIAGIFFAAYLGARVSGNWQGQVPERWYKVLVPQASEVMHPR
jgi:polyferredoxin